jgi:UDP-glucose 4-epimerase
MGFSIRSVVITGAGGFLGSHCARWFLNEGCAVVGIGRGAPSGVWLEPGVQYLRWNLPDSRWDELISQRQPELCVHCAGRSTVAVSLEQPWSDFADGPLLTFALLEGFRLRSPLTRFVHMSSAAVYGQPARLPVAETQSPQPISPYGYHKWQSELICQEFARLFGLRTASLRVFSAYGPGLRKQVVYDICQKLLAGTAGDLQGTGTETRDFVYAADVAQAAWCVAQRAPMQGETYNVASGVETAIRALAERLAERLIDRRGSGSAAARSDASSLRFSGELPRGVPNRWQADINRLTALGYQPRVPLTEGLSHTTQWLLDELRLRRALKSA